MNPITIVSQFTALPEGVAIESLRQRVTVVLGMAVAIALPLPSSPLEETGLRDYFRENVVGIRDRLFKINEAQPFDLDRACEYAFQMWSRRYRIAFKPTGDDLINLRPFSTLLKDLIPELENLKIVDADIRGAVALLVENDAA